MRSPRALEWKRYPLFFKRKKKTHLITLWNEPIASFIGHLASVNGAQSRRGKFVFNRFAFFFKTPSPRLSSSRETVKRKLCHVGSSKYDWQFEWELGGRRQPKCHFAALFLSLSRRLSGTEESMSSPSRHYCGERWEKDSPQDSALIASRVHLKTQIKFQERRAAVHCMDEWWSEQQWTD